MDDERYERDSGQAEDHGGAVTEEAPPAAELPKAKYDAQAYSDTKAAAEQMIAQQLEQDQKLLDELDAVLEHGTAYKTRSERDPNVRKVRRRRGFAKRGAGLISLGVIMIFMGVVMIKTLTAAVPNYTIPLKMSPVCAVIIGAEILISEVLTHGRSRINIPSLIISVLFVTGCCVLSSNLSKDYKVETVLFNNRTVAGDIYDRSYKELKGLADIIKLDVEVNLNPDGDGKFNGADALSASDIVDISAELGGVYEKPADFAADCKKIIDSYRKMKINITNFHFKNESRLRAFSLDIEGKYTQDYDVDRITELVNYVYIVDYDYIEDLEDYSEPTDDSSDADYE